MAKMTAKKVLLSSFSVWQPNQRSNASDDLLLAVLPQWTRQTAWQDSGLHYLRQLPVNVPVASEMAIAKIAQLQPDVILICGMAASRTKLSVESQAVVAETTLGSSLDLAALTQDLAMTEISHDAGRFVCNGLYFTLLNYLQTHSKKIACLFIHVPILTPQNRSPIVSDFCLLLERVQQLEKA